MVEWSKVEGRKEVITKTRKNENAKKILQPSAPVSLRLVQPKYLEGNYSGRRREEDKSLARPAQSGTRGAAAVASLKLWRAKENAEKEKIL